MKEDIDTCIPTVILLLREPREMTVDDVRRVVSGELGDDIGASVAWIGDNSAGMSYFEFRSGSTPYHVGTCTEPYISRFGEGRLGDEIRWSMKEEVPPQDPALCDAWMAHTAWLYVDALNIGPSRDERNHLGTVLRLAGLLVDDRCVLLWRPGHDPKRVALPSQQTVRALRSGVWPA